MRISELEGQRVAVWGWGAEGRAAFGAIRRRLPGSHLTLLVDEGGAPVFDLPSGENTSVVMGVDATQLSAFDVVIKSPGISAVRPEIAAACETGTRFMGGTALWFAEHPAARTLCVTGTKGKSTTTALLAHLLRAGGHRTALAGNIGLPLLDLLDPDVEPDFWCIELSSFQTRDVAASRTRPTVAVVLNLFPEHLDWHGTRQRYVADKLALLTGAEPHVAVLPANDAFLREHVAPSTRLAEFGAMSGWHVADGAIVFADEPCMPLAALPIPGFHNAANLCAALTAIDAVGINARELLPFASDFQPLPHRLQRLGTLGGISFVNDSISTTPHASIAALESLPGERVVIIVGGHDRGLDWAPFAAHVAEHPPIGIVTQGANGTRIRHALEDAAASASTLLEQCAGVESAVARARALLDGEGTVLLSPGAPSFDAYRDYADRGMHFTRVAGFDDAVQTAIAGLGIA